MTGRHGFDEDYWERRWREDGGEGAGAMSRNPANPYLARELGSLTPGTALDAGCGAGAEAMWLAAHGWEVTAADISSAALARAAERADATLDPGAAARLRWVRADLGDWTPEAPFDLVTTHYAHPAMPQLEFYDRLAGWVAPGGTLLLVGHGAGGGSGHGHSHGHGRDGHPPAEASVTAADVTARLDAATWEVLTAEEPHRTMPGPAGEEVVVHDVVVRARRRG